jgi:hypothetical protein
MRAIYRYCYGVPMRRYTLLPTQLIMCAYLGWKDKPNLAGWGLDLLLWFVFLPAVMYAVGGGLQSKFVLAIVRPVLPFFLGATLVLNLRSHQHVMAVILVLVFGLNLYTSMKLDTSAAELMDALGAANFTTC